MLAGHLQSKDPNSQHSETWRFLSTTQFVYQTHCGNVVPMGEQGEFLLVRSRDPVMLLKAAPCLSEEASTIKLSPCPSNQIVNAAH